MVEVESSTLSSKTFIMAIIIFLVIIMVIIIIIVIIRVAQVVVSWLAANEDQKNL